VQQHHVAALEVLAEKLGVLADAAGVLGYGEVSRRSSSTAGSS
jgi:hypothetical protein